MRPPRPTIRALMVVVAVSALVSAYAAGRRKWFPWGPNRLAADYAALMLFLLAAGSAAIVRGHLRSSGKPGR